MTKAKGPKKAKMPFTVARFERKKTRHLSPAALSEYNAKKAATVKKAPAPAKA